MTRSNRLVIGCLLLLSIMIWAEPAPASGLSFADFVPPSQGGPDGATGPVHESQGVVEAQTAQDGLNYASNRLRLQASSPNSAFREIRYPSGLGYLAAASASYEVFDNPNATMISLRAAYMKAYLKARAELAKGLQGISVRSTERLRDIVRALDTPDASVANNDEMWQSHVQEYVEALLRGYVVFEVNDDQKNKLVYVSVATTAKTVLAANSVMNVSDGLVCAADLPAGVDYVLGRILAGVVPPVGGTIVTVPSTGATAIVSFGSAIIRQNEDPSVQLTLKNAAERAARAYANAAFVALVQGDNLMWEGGLLETQDQSYQQFREVYRSEGGNPDVEMLGQTQKTFKSAFESTDAYASIASGKLPPGVAYRAYEDGYWMYVINVYIPGASLGATRFYEMMKGAVTGPRLMTDKYEGKGTGSKPQQGPSGQVTSADDL